MAKKIMQTPKRITSRGNCKGFTLIELMIAMAISGIVLMAAFKIYTNQQQHYTAQLEVTEMQQNIRAALNLLSRDIRMAGYEEAGAGVAKIEKATANLFDFTVDLNEDGDVADAGERIVYSQYIPDPPAAQKPTLGRSNTAATLVGGVWVSTGQQPAAENIDQLEFFYLDEDGNPTTSENQIQTVVISILARADQPDPTFQNTQTYTPASNLAMYGGSSGLTWTKNDNFRRRLQIMRVECRNMGIN